MAAEDHIENTPLLLAIQAGDRIDLVRALVERGADITHATAGGWTPLMQVRGLRFWVVVFAVA